MAFGGRGPRASRFRAATGGVRQAHGVMWVAKATPDVDLRKCRPPRPAVATPGRQLDWKSAVESPSCRTRGRGRLFILCSSTSAHSRRFAARNRFDPRLAAVGPGRTRISCIAPGPFGARPVVPATYVQSALHARACACRQPDANSWQRRSTGRIVHTCEVLSSSYDIGACGLDGWPLSRPPPPSANHRPTTLPGSPSSSGVWLLASRRNSSAAARCPQSIRRWPRGDHD